MKFFSYFFMRIALDGKHVEYRPEAVRQRFYIRHQFVGRYFGDKRIVRYFRIMAVLNITSVFQYVAMTQAFQGTINKD